jgi:hypothetical protein
VEGTRAPRGRSGGGFTRDVACLQPRGSSPPFRPRSTPRAVAHGAGGGWCVVRCCRRSPVSAGVGGVSGDMAGYGCVPGGYHTPWVSRHPSTSSCPYSMSSHPVCGGRRAVAWSLLGVGRFASTPVVRSIIDPKKQRKTVS